MTSPANPTSSPTPRPLRLILWVLFATTLISTAIPTSFPYLSLSLQSLQNYHLWTLLTYPFTAPPAPSVPLLIHLFFHLALLWFFGIPVLARIRSTHFLLLFFGSTLFAALASIPTLFLTPHFLAGATPPLLALITAWAILHAERGIPLLHAFLIRPYWIFLLFIGSNLLTDLLERSWVQLAADSGAVFYGYLFTLIAERTRSTISLLYPFEKLILRTLEKPAPRGSKIVDFATGKPLDDDAFMDAMLAQIAQRGIESLTPAQKQRMEQISQKRKR